MAAGEMLTPPGIIPARAGFTHHRRERGHRQPDHPRSRGVYRRRSSPPGGTRGSSPLARGLPSAQVRYRADGGIIPARAGFTRTLICSVTRLRDHPRSRGVYAGVLDTKSPRSGSSPLARGLRCRPRPDRPHGGDHPRSRGVYKSSDDINRLTKGSSPLARGLPGQGAGQTPLLGIIPARAGFTSHRSRQGRGGQDHPRSRGVYTSWYRPGSPKEGSSPLARGLLQPVLSAVWTGRIIPARAGFTTRPRRRGRRPRDHPRSRGVYPRERRPVRRLPGSSPLARGLRSAGRERPGQRRIIPARAGFTRYPAGRYRCRRDHPRSRGVYPAGYSSM